MWCSKRQSMLGPGAKAPAIALKTLQGENWSLHEALRTSPVVLVFFKISCPTCQFSLPFLNRLAATGGGQVVAISQDDAVGTRQFLEHFRVGLPTLLDEPRTFPASNAFQITHVPSLFLVEQDGTISWSVNGFNKTELEKLAERLQVPLFRPDEQVPSLRPG